MKRSLQDVDNLQLSKLSAIPTSLTLFRVVAGFLVIILYDPLVPPHLAAAVALAVCGEISDHLDGPLARRLGTQSKMGYILDGLADRSLYSALILAIFVSHNINRLLVWLLLFGQILIYAIRVLLVNWHVRVRSVRLLHILHWVGLRLWVLSYVIGDLCRAWSLSLPSSLLGIEKFSKVVFPWAAVLFLYSAITITVSELLEGDSGGSVQ